MPVKIKLTKGCEAIIDEQDYEFVNAFKWRAKKASKHSVSLFYAVHSFTYNGKRTDIKMEQLILGDKEGYVIDHINNNPSDNTRKNLRYATTAQNNLNKTSWAKTGIGYRGVYYKDNKRKYYEATIKVMGKKYRSPVTCNKHIAALYYNILVLKHTSGFGKLNTVPSKCLLDRHN